MIVAHHIPRPPLSAFVKVFWYWDSYLQPHAKERLLPDGCMTLVFNLSEERTHTSRNERCASSMPSQVISGARSRYFEVETSNMVCTLGVQFQPGGAFPFFHIPACELDDQCVALEDVYGSAARSIRARLLDAPTPEDKFRTVEQWLLSRLAKPLEHHPAVHYATAQIVRNPIAQSVSRLVESIGFSQRHFNRLFAAQVGLTPKLFSRVRRFQRVIASIGSRDRVDWADLALDCGYYDQAHFVHDFRSFSGLTPAAYLEQRSPHLNHVPILD